MHGQHIHEPTLVLAAGTGQPLSGHTGGHGDVPEGSAHPGQGQQPPGQGWVSPGQGGLSPGPCQGWWQCQRAVPGSCRPAVSQPRGPIRNEMFLLGYFICTLQ